MVTIRFQSELPTSKNDLNQVSYVSLLRTSLMVLANEGLFELTKSPSLARAVEEVVSRNYQGARL